MDRKYLMFVTLILCSLVGRTQEEVRATNHSKKGKFYFEWGYNRAWHSNSSIHLKGKGYDFTLKDASASDYPAPFDPSVYMSITQFSVPQFNIRLGYQINEKYSVSIGYDHMKYVLDNWKNGKISGYISEEAIDEGVKTNSPQILQYVGVYDNDEIYLSQSLIKYEHTDGLNYVRINLDRTDQLWASNSGKLAIKAMYGFGGGPMFPWTDYTLLSGKRHTNRLHFSGFGVSANAGIKVDFFDRFYLQSNTVAGYINMPWVETAMGQDDSATQEFTFFQFNVVAGVYFSPQRIFKKNK